METKHKIYLIKKGDTLEKIAEDLGILTNELREFHNRYCELGNLIGSEKLPKELSRLIIPLIIEKKTVVPVDEVNSPSSSFNPDSEIRYRCEQTVLTKLDGVILNNMTMKTEFTISRNQSEKGLFIKVKLVENIANYSTDDSMVKVLDLINAIDLIKCDVVVSVNPQDGRINKIINHKEIIKKWETHKKSLLSEYNFLRSQDTKDKLNTFISMAESQIKDEAMLIQDLGTKMFFHLLFNKYLVTSKNLFEPYQSVFASQLFEEIVVNLKFRQDILSETSETVTIRKVGELDRSQLDLPAIEKIYNAKYKPNIEYQFSTFNFSYRERNTINTQDKILEQAEVTIIEEVKNNIQVLISFNLRKLD